MAATHNSTRGRRSERIRVALLAGGPAAFLWYVGLDTLASLLYDGYSYADQTISELSAVGAPTRRLWQTVGMGYGLFTLACAAGIHMSARGSRALRVLAALVAAMALVSLFAWPFAPMHQREVLAAGGGTASDSAHIALAFVNTALFLGAMICGLFAGRGRFRWFTIATIAVVFCAGIGTAAYGNRIAEDEPTPWMGIVERVAVFGSMLWIAVLALSLMRTRPALRVQNEVGAEAAAAVGEAAV